MAGSGRAVRAVVRVATVVAAVSSLALGGVAVSALVADDRQALAAEAPGPADREHEAVSAPRSPSVAVPVGQEVLQVTPGRNPPLMALGSSSEDVRELQVRLAHLDLFDATVTGYYGEVTKRAVTAYQERTGGELSGEIYPDVWSALRAETPEPTQDELYPPPPAADPPSVDPGSLDPRCLTGRVLCISKADNALRWVVNGRIVLEMDARFGRPGMETDEGVFSVFWKSRDHVSTIYEADMPFALFFSGGQAVHYSPEFASIGYTGVGSHGCVNIRDYANMAWLFDQVNVNDKVVVSWS